MSEAENRVPSNENVASEGETTGVIGAVTLVSAIDACKRMGARSRAKAQAHPTDKVGSAHARGHAEAWAECERLLRRVERVDDSEGVTRTTWAELDEVCAPIGGPEAIPQLVDMVSGMMPGDATLPPAWAAWLRERIAAREPFVLRWSSPEGGHRLEIGGDK